MQKSAFDRLMWNRLYLYEIQVAENLTICRLKILYTKERLQWKMSALNAQKHKIFYKPAQLQETSGKKHMKKKRKVSG